MKSISIVFCLLLFGVSLNCVQAVDPKQDGTDAALKAAAAFRVPREFTIELFAAEPKLENPVAICIDDKGYVYVAEEHRFNEGTEENRTRPFLLEDDLQIRTLDDRMAMFKKWEDKFEGGMSWFTRASDIVRRLEDRNTDGKADVSTVFANGFNDPLAGLGSGLIARHGKVWYTCIPDLWLLEDQDSDGKADQKTSLLRGFGVNAAFLGHDLHGLVWGPDGRLYFSVGDRGAHVVSKEGATISNPRNGAVYRCNPDGTELELIHKGLRNPQELAFDQYGNLFADDNNCDKGDHSRLVYVVPGGESGWNMAFQTIPEPYLTGPWHAEGIWKLSHDLQPAYIVPPVGKIGAGPSGFVFSSGVGLPKRYRNHFFYCNFTGNGGVESFAVKSNGASFSIIDHQDFCKPVLASDVDFGYDGKMYISTYPVSPWDRKTSGGRIFTIFDKSQLEKPIIKETVALFHEGFEVLTLEQLTTLLSHADMRVRLRAQFALADRSETSVEPLQKLATHSENQLTRLHAIWGLGQIARSKTSQSKLETLQPVLKLLQDQDSEIRAQALKVLGEANLTSSAKTMIPLLKDDSLRVQFFAAIALGTLKSEGAITPIIEMLRVNNGKDRYVTHAGVRALELIGNREQVQLFASDKSAAVRMAALLVQRRWRDPLISQFLNDVDLKIVTEAARAINDLPLQTEELKLANLAERFRNAEGDQVAPLMRRIINANFRIGNPSNIKTVIGIVTSEKQAPAIRAEAVAALANWSGPTKRDRVTGYWRQTKARNVTPVRDAIEQTATNMLSSTTDNLQIQVTELLAKLKVKTDDVAIATWVMDDNRSEGARIAALRLLASHKFEALPKLINAALSSNHPRLRAEARDQLAEIDAARATLIFSELLDNEQVTVQEKQHALTTLSRMKLPKAVKILDHWANRLRQNNVPVALQLDLLDALNSSNSKLHKNAINQFKRSADHSDPLSQYQVALKGGNAKEGREVFVSHITAQCYRCHSVSGTGGTAGPDLSKIASPERNTDRRFLLESIMFPNAKIAKGFGTVSLVLESGKIIAGTIKSEDVDSLTIVTPQNKIMRVSRNEIEAQSTTSSAMPEMKKMLSLHEIRDLVEYLSTLNGTK
ncbi:PVC-type heme-binding CxxCH protein [uncultured Gimesia sp.]|uniref:PVC-type heme-binding CxxCH protein n=1 Tax=uncultured Gimesia sp. TaxID=1678688 RepID=UPI0026271963|nr:PVC-type heme-binding CxxCH protein [uncultured Gimesia sp.]